MTVSVRYTLPGDLSYITHRLRASDRDEIFATMPADPDLLAALAWHSVSWVGVLNGAPVAALGIKEMWAGVWQVWMFGTDDFKKVGKRLVHRAQREGWPLLRGQSVRRLQCMSSALHVEAHEFIERMGGRREATLRSYGKNGEDFHIYTWLVPFRE